MRGSVEMAGILLNSCAALAIGQSPQEAELPTLAITSLPLASDYSIPVHNTQPASSVSPMTTAVVMTVVVSTAGVPIVAAAGEDEGHSEKQQDKKRFFHDSLLRLLVGNFKRQGWCQAQNIQLNSRFQVNPAFR